MPCEARESQNQELLRKMMKTKSSGNAMIDRRISIVQISEVLIQACPVLTIYEKDLLKLRYAQGKKVSEIADYYNKSKGTVSPQISRALEKFDSWCKSNEKQVSRIEEENKLKTSSPEPDQDLKDRQSTFDELQRRNVLGERKLDLKLKIKEEHVRDLEIQVRNDPSEFARYAERLFPTLFREIVQLVGERTAGGDVVKALERFTPFEEWGDERDEGRFYDYAKHVMEPLVKGKKTENSLDKFKTEVPIILTCPKCRDEDLEVQVEFNRNSLDQLVCPRCKQGWVWRCRVCAEVENGVEVSMRYNIEGDEICCAICGHHRPVYPLEEEGTVASRRSRIIEETREELGSAVDAAKYADSVVFPRNYL